jgi:hypothetical protein
MSRSTSGVASVGMLSAYAGRAPDPIRGTFNKRFGLRFSNFSRSELGIATRGGNCQDSPNFRPCLMEEFEDEVCLCDYRRGCALSRGSRTDRG